MTATASRARRHRRRALAPPHRSSAAPASRAPRHNRRRRTPAAPRRPAAPAHPPARARHAQLCCPARSGSADARAAFLLLVASSITIALLLLGISLRVHVTESGGLHARRSYTDLAPHVLLTKLCLLHTDTIKITVVSYLILNYGEISECTAPVPVSQFKPLRERPWSPSWRPQACAASIFRAWPTVRDGLGVRQQRWPWARWRARPSCRRPAASCQSRCPA